ncbi:MAG: nucleoside 2-deoxyribosyltransferase [Anaerolineales bacterium]|nr:nucleoside 2-deoxyribosyltransferase [Anaerolineales bacterium]
MNIYFSCSVTGGREYEAIYQEIVQSLQEDGHEIPTAELAGADIVEKEQTADPEDIYSRDMNWIRACDLLVAEISAPSHGVGYEIGFALSRGKPVFCLHEAGRPVSKMITGNPDPKLKVRAYTGSAMAIGIIRDFLAELQAGM